MKFKRNTKANMRKRAAQPQRATESWKNDVFDRLTKMEAHAEATNRGVRRRALPAAIAGMVALFGMVGLVSQNAFAVNFTGSNQVHYMFSDYVAGTNNGIYIDKQATQDGGKPAAEIGFKNAKLNGFCMLAPQQIPGFGTVLLKLTAGETVDGTVDANATPISIDNLYVAAADVQGSGQNITNMYVGRNASDIPADTGLTGFAGTAGGFGITASTMDVKNFSSAAQSVQIAGPLSLPGLHISVSLNSTTPNASMCS